jgi:ribose transport system permease protein
MSATAPPAEASPPASRGPSAYRKWARALGPFLGLALVVAFFAAVSGNPARFLSPENLRIVLTQTVIVALGAIGMTIVMVAGGIDLSVGSVIALASVVAALALRASWPPILALAAGIAAGGLVGLVNGVAITRLRVVPFIATLGMLGVARGAAKWAASEQTVNIPSTWLNELATSYPSRAWMLVAPGVWITVVLAIAAAVMLRRTVFGRRVFALGSNEAAARAWGIEVDRLKLWIYSVGGLFFGLAGVVEMSRLRQGDPTVAIGVELDVIAAVVIGGASLSGGEGSVLGSMVGALIMAFLRNGCQLMGWPNYVQEIIIGTVIVFAVAADQLRVARAREA